MDFELIAKTQLPNVKFWQMWLNEVSLKDDFDAYDNLSKRALTMCPHVDLVLDMLDHVADLFENDQLVSGIEWK